MTKLKETVVCKNCCIILDKITKTFIICPHCNKKMDTRYRSFYTKNYDNYKIRLNKLQNYKGARKTNWNFIARKVAMNIISNNNLKCVKCGCDDFRFLEINHKNGGGSKELKGFGYKFYWDIYKKRRDTNDLEILCKICNALHYLELKTKEELPFKVCWK